MSTTSTTYRRPERNTMQLLYRFAGTTLARGGSVIVGPGEAAVLCHPAGRSALLGTGSHTLAPGTGDLGGVVAATPPGVPIPGPLYFVRTREMTGQSLQGTVSVGGVQFKVRALLSFAVEDPAQLVRAVALPRSDADGPSVLTAMSRGALVHLGRTLAEGAAPGPAPVQAALQGFLVQRGIRVTGVGPVEVVPTGASDPQSLAVRVVRALGLSPGDEIEAERSEGETVSGPVHRVVVGGRARAITRAAAPPQAAAPASPAARPAVRYVRCPQCGAVDEAGRFCGTCGAPLQAAVPVEVALCKSCGRASPAGTPYCSSCGTPLQAQ